MAAVARTVHRFPAHKASVVVFKCKTVVLDEEQRMLMAEILLKSGLCSFPTPGHSDLIKAHGTERAVAASRSAATAIQAPFLRAAKALKYLHLSLVVTCHVTFL
ncbi:hypothetical protein V6N13_050456 [Hibiscus sabdariffa]